MMARHSCDKGFKMNGVKEKGQIKRTARLWHDRIHQMKEQNLFSLQAFDYKLSNVHDHLNFWYKLKVNTGFKDGKRQYLRKNKKEEQIFTSRHPSFIKMDIKLNLQNLVLFRYLILFRFIIECFYVRKLLYMCLQENKSNSEILADT